MRFSSNVKIFWTTAKIFIGKQMVYRFNFLMPYVLRLFQIVGSLVVWRALFVGKETINGYTFKEMVSYLIIAQFAVLVFYPFHMFSLQIHVRKGTIYAYLLRPCHYMLVSAAEFFGVKFFHLTLFAIVYAIFATWGGYDIGLMQIMMFLFSFSLAFFFGFFISCLAFFIVEMWPIKNLFIACMAILGGTVVPLDLLPKYISSWAPYTPFAYFSYVNVKVFQNELTEALIQAHLLNLVFMNIVFIVLSYVTFFLGVKRYEGVGC